MSSSTVENECGNGCAQLRHFASMGINIRVCPRCGAGFRGDGYVYAIQARGPEGPVKIGFSRDPWKRLRELQTGCPDELRLLAVEPNSVPEDERRYHASIGAPIRGEWFDYAAASETVRWLQGAARGTSTSVQGRA